MAHPRAAAKTRRVPKFLFRVGRITSLSKVYGAPGNALAVKQADEAANSAASEA